MTKKKGILIGVIAVLAVAVIIVVAVVLTAKPAVVSFANPNDADVEKITLIIDRRSGELSGEELRTFTDAFETLSGTQVAEDEAKETFEMYLGGVTGLRYRFSDGHTAIFAFSPEDQNLVRVTVTQGTSDAASAEAYFRVQSKDFSRDSIEALKETVSLSMEEEENILPEGAA